MDSARALSLAPLGSVDYSAALALQDALVAARIRDDIGDTLLMLEHPHVFTLGRGADERFLINPADVPVYRVSRGGQVTYHGPGQLIGYPILKLEGSDRDVIAYLRRLEQAIIAALACFAITAGCRDKLTGVWVGSQKIASIGVGIRRWVTLHGFAVNVTTDLSFFDAIVPCGIEGCRMTSLAALTSPTASTDAFADVIASEFAAVFGYGRTSIVAPASLWRFVDSTAQRCEAQR